ncbi:MAG: thioredoxin family protein [Bacteroidota bacterium]|nr:thioredoxin family protein [Bacteroidota bacterium]
MRKLQTRFISWGFLLFSFYVTVNAQSSGVKFLDISLRKALTQASEANKLVFIDCYTSWCGPCKTLSREVFPQKSVGDFFNQNFICLSIDMERGDGPDIAKRYEVKAYPTLLFLDATGEVVHRSVGAGNADAMVSLGKTAVDPAKNQKGIDQKLSNGDNSVSVIRSALKQSQQDVKKVEPLLDLYFKDKNEDEWFDRDSWELIRDYAWLSTKYGDFLMHNVDNFISLYGKDNVEKSVVNKVANFYWSYSYLGFSLNECINYLDAFNSPLVLKGIYQAKIGQARHRVIADAYSRESWLDYINLLKDSYKFPKSEYNLDYQQFVDLFFNKNAFRDGANINRICKILSKIGSPLAIKICNELILLKNSAIIRGGDLFKEVKDEKELKLFSEKEIQQILSECSPLLDSCEISKMHANNIAWDMLRHPNRTRFLSMAQKFSYHAVTDGNDNFYCFHTYAAICAQIGQFDEAIKYQELAVENVRKTSPKKLSYYTDWLEKFKNKQTIF